MWLPRGPKWGASSRESTADRAWRQATWPILTLFVCRLPPIVQALLVLALASNDFMTLCVGVFRARPGTNDRLYGQPAGRYCVFSRCGPTTGAGVLAAGSLSICGTRTFSSSRSDIRCPRSGLRRPTSNGVSSPFIDACDCRRGVWS